MFPAVPMPVCRNGLPQVMSPATHGKSYGFLETLEILREKHRFWTAELAARNGSPRRLPARGEKLSWEPTENVGILYVSNALLRVQHWNDVPDRKKVILPFYREVWGNRIAVHLIWVWNYISGYGMSYTSHKSGSECFQIKENAQKSKQNAYKSKE